MRGHTLIFQCLCCYGFQKNNTNFAHLCIAIDVHFLKTTFLMIKMYEHSLIIIKGEIF